MMQLWMTLIAQSGDKMDKSYLGAVIFFPLLAAWVVWSIARKKEKATGSHRLAIYALIPLLVGVALGVAPVKNITTESYRSFHRVSDRSEMLHYAALIIPLVFSVALIVWQFMRERRHKLEQ